MSAAEEAMEAAIENNEELKGELEENEDDGKIELSDEEQPKPAEAEEVVEENKPEDKDDGEFSIDEDEAEDQPEEPVGAEAASGAKLTPEQQYLVDNIAPLTLSVKVGDKVQEFTVYSPEQLPDDFEYMSTKQGEVYRQTFARMERQAETLQNQYKQLQNVEQGKKYEELENRAVRQDIADLQKSGAIAKFKVKTDDPGFSEDAAAREIQDVVDFMTERNDSYMKSYNSGGAYRHIGFSEAFALYKAANPGETNTDKEDKARHDLAKRLGGSSQGASAAEKVIPIRGRTTEQILQKYGA